MKIQCALILGVLIYTQSCMAEDRIETEEMHCARTLSSISAILLQLKNNPAVRQEQITAVIDGHTSDPAMRTFIRTEVAPRIFSGEARSAEAYINSRAAQEKCLQALNTYVGFQGK